MKNLLFIENLIKKIPLAVTKVKIFRNNDVTIFIKKDYLNIVVYFLKMHSNCLFKVVVDITGVDNLGKSKRFSIIYNLLSIHFNNRIRLEISLNEIDFINSITNIHKGANWLEREVKDMFGIYFLNHPDLRRILTDYGFEGYPLRKDFPLSGYIELRYDDEKKRIVYEPVEISQELRTFNFKSPWDPFSSIDYN